MAGSFIFTDDIIREFDRNKENIPDNGHPVTLSKTSLGRIIKDVWGQDVKPAKKVRERGTRNAVPGYINLGRCSTSPTCLNTSFVEECTGLLRSPPDGWTVIGQDDTRISFTKLENWKIDRQRVVTEVSVQNKDVRNYKISILSHGFSIDVEDLNLGTQIKGATLQNVVNLVLRFVDNSSKCTGFPVGEKGISCSLPHRLARIETCSVESSPNEIRAFAQHCKVFAPTGSHCPACTSLSKVETKKRSREEARECIHPNSNNKHLSREGLLHKLKKLKTDRKNTKDREKRLRGSLDAEMVELERDDHVDLLQMLEKVEKIKTYQMTCTCCGISK